jgi:IS5 family transposase
MLLTGIWYGLDDERVEAMLNDSLSAMRFYDLCIEDDVPDHSVLSVYFGCIIAKSLTKSTARHP